MNDDFLKRMRKPPRREFADELYERINRPMNESRFGIEPYALRRAAFAAGAVGLLLILTVIISPAARTFAEAQFRQVGALIFRPIDHESSTAVQPTMAAPGDASPVEKATSLEDASRLAGFTVMAPDYLPEGYAVDTVWSIDRQVSGLYVVSSFRNEPSSQFLLLNQVTYAPGASFEQSYGENEQLSEVRVRGHSGVWISGRFMTDPTDHSPQDAAEPRLYPTNWLVWHEGSITYALFGNGLSQQEMIKIAESLAR